MRLTTTIPDLCSNHADDIDSERRTLVKGIIRVHARVEHRKECGAAVVESTSATSNQ